MNEMLNPSPSFGGHLYTPWRGRMRRQWFYSHWKLLAIWDEDGKCRFHAYTATVRYMVRWTRKAADCKFSWNERNERNKRWDHWRSKDTEKNEDEENKIHDKLKKTTVTVYRCPLSVWWQWMPFSNPCTEHEPRQDRQITEIYRRQKKNSQPHTDMHTHTHTYACETKWNETKPTEQQITKS